LAGLPECILLTWLDWLPRWSQLPCLARLAWLPRLAWLAWLARLLVAGTRTLAA